MDIKGRGSQTQTLGQTVRAEASRVGSTPVPALLAQRARRSPQGAEKNSRKHRILLKMNPMIWSIQLSRNWVCVENLFPGDFG